TEPDLGSAGIRSTVGIMVDTAEEVDELTEHMRNAGARVTKEPVDAEFFAGRSAYLCDPEDNYFEITWAEPNNPITLRRMTRA
ncbi:VOC family protein, partial [Mycobacterium sp.]|uniref:VOC family protein n=1 Tax=Mycobacterium sp. TaxID=1785 RepID=UPI003C74DC08